LYVFREKDQNPGVQESTTVDPHHRLHQAFALAAVAHIDAGMLI
jgi:hypothetical protein